MAKETLEATAETSVERANAQLAGPIKCLKYRLADSMLRELTHLKNNTTMTPVEESLLGVQDLYDKRAQLVSDWLLPEDLGRKIQEVYITQYGRLENSQKEYDDEITETMDDVKNNIAAKCLS